MSHIKTALLKRFDSIDLSGCVLLFQSRPRCTDSVWHALMFTRRPRHICGVLNMALTAARFRRLSAPDGGGGGELGGFCSSKTKMLDRGKLMCERELADRQCIVGSFPSFMFWESSTKKPAEAPQEGGGDNEKFDYLSCTLFSAIIHTRN